MLTLVLWEPGISRCSHLIWDLFTKAVDLWPLVRFSFTALLHRGAQTAKATALLEILLLPLLVEQSH